VTHTPPDGWWSGKIRFKVYQEDTSLISWYLWLSQESFSTRLGDSKVELISPAICELKFRFLVAIDANSDGFARFRSVCLF